MEEHRVKMIVWMGCRGRNTSPICARDELKVPINTPYPTVEVQDNQQMGWLSFKPNPRVVQA